MSVESNLSVYFFVTHSGNEPVREWLKVLDKEDRKKLGEDIKLLQFRWPLGMPLVRKMETELWELRSNLSGSRIARLFFTVKNDQIILLHSFVKKSQKTPQKEIDLARQRKNQWLREE